MRLNKFLAQSGITSRRKADELIQKGEVLVNGKPVTELGTQIDPEKDKISLKSNPKKTISKVTDYLYVALNKPKGYISTLSDELNRETITDLLPPHMKNKGLKPIGRLDKNTEGLLILTNDTELINQLLHPRYEHEKEYKAVVKGPLTTTNKQILEKGILLPEERTKTLPCKIHIIKASNQETTLTIILKEGKKRQIRKMFKQIDQPVIYLQRIRFGSLALGTPPLNSLPLGKTKLIDKKCFQA